jgi:hypothetical protein
MTRILKSVAVAAAAAAALAVGLPATQASAIDKVDCNYRTDFTQITGHGKVGTPEQTWCFANAGATTWSGGYGINWLTSIQTGNNVVQWHGDGRWQPDAPIDKWTTYIFPNHPGGVSVDGIFIH